MVRSTSCFAPTASRAVDPLEYAGEAGFVEVLTAAERPSSPRKIRVGSLRPPRLQTAGDLPERGPAPGFGGVRTPAQSGLGRSGDVRGTGVRGGVETNRASRVARRPTGNEPPSRGRVVHGRARAGSPRQYLTRGSWAWRSSARNSMRRSGSSRRHRSTRAFSRELSAPSA